MAAKDTEPKKPEESPDGAGPMLDMSQAAVKKMIATAKSRGYITYDELNEVLPPDQVTSEQIEDVMAMLSEMGINVIDNDEAEDEDGGRDDAPPAADDGGSRELAMTSVGGEALDRTDDPVRMYLREMGSVELLSPRGRDRHRQAHRGRAQHDDRRPLREPADLPGDHHLARRAARRGDHAARRDRPRDHLLRPDGARRGRERALGDQAERPRRRAGTRGRAAAPGAAAPRRRGPPPPRRDDDDDEEEATTRSRTRRPRRRRPPPIPTRRRTRTRATCRSPRWRRR